MSTVIAKNVQVGTSGTAANNFTLYQPATPDGTVRLANGNSGTTTDLVIVTSAGNVGIGTSSPQTKLEVSSGAANTYIRINDTRASAPYVGSESGALVFGRWGVSENARIDTNGSLLVGTTSSNGARLAVTQSGAGPGAPSVYIQNTNNVTNAWNIYSVLPANSNTGSAVHFSGLTVGAGAWYLLGNGTSSWSSDSRLKKNIETTRDGYVEDLCKLRVVKYHWNNNEDNAPKELGLIAQEVEQVFPGLVMDQLAPAEDGETYKMVKGSVLPYMLLKAIQEQQAVITQRQADVAALKAAQPE